MSQLNTARAQIREAMIDTMDPSEIRDLVGKIESFVDGGYRLDEEALEEYVAEVIGGREPEGDKS